MYKKSENISNHPAKIELFAGRVNLEVLFHSRCSGSSVKRSAKSATVSTAASECFMVVLVWLQRHETSAE